MPHRQASSLGISRVTMNNPTINRAMLIGLLLVQVLVLAGCASNVERLPWRTGAPDAPSIATALPGEPSPTTLPTSAPTAAPTAMPTVVALPSQSVSGGGVVVTVKPITLAPGEPAAFDVAMNSHSVEIVEDMVAATVLRDDAGNQFPATAWEGAGPGGHHREGVIRFGTLSGEPKELVLVIRGVAKVPERVFRWTPSGSLG